MQRRDFLKLSIGAAAAAAIASPAIAQGAVGLIPKPVAIPDIVWRNPAA